MDCLRRGGDGAGKGDQPVHAAFLAQNLKNAGELMRAAGTARIVEAHGEIAPRGHAQTVFDQGKGFQIVRQVDRAEIMAQRRARRRRRRQHGGDPGQDGDVQSMVMGRRFQSLEQGRGHGEDPGSPEDTTTA
jgi:hypothetical protein